MFLFFILHQIKRNQQRKPLPFWRINRRNQAISAFCGQAPCTRINLSILQSFLHFLRANGVNNFQWELEEINFQGQRNSENTRVKFHLKFYFNGTFNFFFSICCCSKWFLSRTFLKQLNKGLQYNVNNLCTKFLSIQLFELPAYPLLNTLLIKNGLRKY